MKFFQQAGILGIIILLMPNPVSARLLFVPDEYPTIQAAIDAAETGDEVIVRDGTYEGEGFRDIRFMGKAITVRSENGPEHCVINGTGSYDDYHGFIFDHGETESSILKGFAINNFRTLSSQAGIGVRITGSAPTILDCEFRNNYARVGGAIFISGPPAPVLIANCRFISNQASTYGGAICVHYGQIEFIGNYFEDNRAGMEGGAISLTDVTGIIADSIFDSNLCHDRVYDCYGGAIGGWGPSSIDIINCLMVNNIARGVFDSGGGYSTYGYGGAIFLQNHAHPEPGSIVNTTIYGNRVEGLGEWGGVAIFGPLVVRSSLFWENRHWTGRLDNYLGDTDNIQFTTVQGDRPFPGEGNSISDPQFNLPDMNSFYLLPGSPAIDSGHTLASDVCFWTPDGEVCLDMLTTSPDGAPDTGIVNRGYHYRDACPYEPTATPTMTPDPCEESGVVIHVPSTMYRPGDPCWCRVVVCNTDPDPLAGYPLFVVLDVYGTLFFAPEFSEFDSYLADYPRFDTGVTVVEVLPEFLWPDGAGSATGIHWIAALTDPEITQIVGEWDMISFGWTEDPLPTPTPTPTSDPTNTPEPPTHTPTPTPTPTGPTPTPPISDFVYIPPGTYIRGSPEDEPCRWEMEGPVHQVTLTRGFYMMTTGVTRQMWADLQAVQPTLPDDPSLTDISPTMDHPIQSVTWRKAILFANLMSIQEGLTPTYYKDATFTIPVDATNYASEPFFCDFDANGYRLPTEAEWEYAARAGTTGPFSTDEPNFSPDHCISCDPDPPLLVLNSIAWWCGNSDTGSGNMAHPVGTKLANPWGLYDMHGNVRTWCWDWLDVYPSDPVTDPSGPAYGSGRVVRGGGFLSKAVGCRSAARGAWSPGLYGKSIGFRLVRTAL